MPNRNQNMSKNKSYSKYTPRVYNKNKRSPQFKPNKLYIEQGDQRVTIKVNQKLETIETGQTDQSSYFHGYSIIKPFDTLINSPYKGYSELYTLVRLTSYTIIVSIPGSHKSLPGATAAKLYRDKRPVIPNPFYEGVVAENNHKRGKSFTTFKFNWYPIEPSDCDFFEFSNVMDAGRYGQINITGIAFPSPFIETYKPLLEYRLTYDFKYLKEVSKPSLLYSLTDLLKQEHGLISDSDEEDIISIKASDLDTTTRTNLYLPSDYRTLKTKHDIMLSAENYFKNKIKH